MLIALQGAVSQGVLWGIMVLGVFITFRLLDIPDMTCDGSFALGGCVCAVLIVNNNVDPLLAVLAGMCAGAIAGAVTGILTTVFEIPAILAGILTQISLWSINLRIMGKSNTPILAKGTVFSAVSNMTGLPQSTVAIILGILLAVAIVAILYWFFGTEIGSALRATGNNEYMIRALGVNTNSTKMIALVLSNALIGLSGALICQFASATALYGLCPAPPPHGFGCRGDGLQPDARYLARYRPAVAGYTGHFRASGRQRLRS